MDFQHLHDLPQWNDDFLRNIDAAADRETWAPNPTRDACKAAYNQWKQVVYFLNSTLGTITENPAQAEVSDDEHTSLIASLCESLMIDALRVAVKLKSTEGANLHVSRMESAAFIREYAAHIYSELTVLKNKGGLDEAYINVVRNEIDTFRKRFKTWVSTFERDEIEDEWGLF